MPTPEDVLHHGTFEDLVEFVNRLLETRTGADVDTLVGFLSDRVDDTYGKQFVPRYIARALLCLGEDGLIRLAGAIDAAPGHIYPLAILQTLFLASHNEVIGGLFLEGPVSTERLCNPEITASMAKTARSLFVDMVLRARTDDHIRGALLGLLQTSWAYGHEEMFSEVYGIVAEAAVALTATTLESFEALIGEDGRPEEDYQKFLSANLVLLDPIALEVVPKHRLGDDYVTDFVIRKANDEYLVVEIERPNTLTFTGSDDFAAPFTHAYGQILDFQDWVESNISYAQKKLPAISSPFGLLVIGRRRDLTAHQRSKLARFNINNRGRVVALCYDDLLDAGWRLYKNLHTI
jgi:hypothetical protein